MLRSGIYSFAFVKLSARTGDGDTPLVNALYGDFA